MEGTPNRALKHLAPEIARRLGATARAALAGTLDLGLASSTIARGMRPSVELPNWRDEKLWILFAADGEMDNFPQPGQRDNWEAGTFQRLMQERAAYLQLHDVEIRAALSEFLRRLGESG
jgi:hypothetical protein